MGIDLPRHDLGEGLGQRAAEAVVQVEDGAHEPIAEARVLDCPTDEAVDAGTVLRDEGLVELDLLAEALLGGQRREIPGERDPEGLADPVEAFPEERFLVAEMPEDGRPRHLGVFSDMGDRGVLVAAAEEKLRRGDEDSLLGGRLAGQRLVVRGLDRQTRCPLALDLVPGHREPPLWLGPDGV